jgi:hypothetical protein
MKRVPSKKHLAGRIVKEQFTRFARNRIVPQTRARYPSIQKSVSSGTYKAPRRKTKEYEHL